MVSFIQYLVVTPARLTVHGLISVEYQIWDKKDQHLLSWILGSVSSGFSIHLVGCNGSYEVWSRLKDLYQTRSKMNILQYKIDLFWLSC